ncbi:MAG TPA: DUF4142 domain-containing protein [Hyphomicrobiales bacterium]|nr:DUF4142 domain-containing protein [Hyphomicrobiales bacterium]
MKLHLVLAAALLVLPAAAMAQGAGGGTDAGTAASPTQPQATAPSGAEAPMRGGRHRGAGQEKPLTAQRFARAAAQGGMFEVQSSQAALQKSQNDEVKKFAQRMIDDHGKANDELQQLAEGEHLKIPPDLNKRNQAQLDQLQGLSGAAFDAEYLKDQRRAHRQAIHLFQRYADTGTDHSLQDWAKKTLPTLREHQAMLRKIKKSS